METLRPLPESAHTDVRAGAARLYVGACLFSLLLVPLFQHLLPSGEEWGPRAGPFADLAAAVASLDAGAGVEEGQGAARRLLRVNRALKRHMDDFERQLERASAIHEQAYPFVQWLLLAYGGAGNETIYPGAGGWLYLRAGFDYLTGPPFLDPAALRRRRLAAPAWQAPPEPDPRPAILEFHRQLAERGIHLLILPAPTKPMVHPEPLSARLSEEGLQNPSFRRFRDQLEAAGVTVFDAAEAMVRARRETGGEQFLRTDSHWSPEGLDAVARALAERIRGLGLAFTGPATPMSRQTQAIEGVGDLERTLLLPSWQRLFKPQTVETHWVDSAPGKPWRPDPRAEVLLLGDSFTNVYAQPDVGWGRGAGLAEQLSYFLERPVDRLAINAGGASGTRQRLADELLSGRDRLAGKKLVVFQFAIRDLAVGDWQVVEAPAGQ
jgi:alginate O-acetyltransferase complex protein AlgJ